MDEVVAPRRFMTVEELAELCRTTPATVRYWDYSGTGPKSCKVGRRRLFATEDVESWLSKAQSGGDAA